MALVIMQSIGTIVIAGACLLLISYVRRHFLTSYPGVNKILVGLGLILFGAICLPVFSLQDWYIPKIAGNLTMLDIVGLAVGYFGGLTLICLGIYQLVTHLHEGTGFLSTISTDAAESQESVSRYRSFIDNSNDAIWRYDLDTPIEIENPAHRIAEYILFQGKVAECNHSFLRLSGYADRNAVFKKSLIDIFPRQSISPAIYEMVESNYQINNQEIYFINSDGKEVYCECSILGYVYRGKLVHLWVTQRDVTHNKRLESSIAHIAAGVSMHAGTAFFDDLVNHLVVIFGVEYAFIGLINEDRKSITSIAASCKGVTQENITYDLVGTPCEKIIEGTLCVFPRDLQQLFPDDHFLQDFNYESYIGTPLLDSNKQIIGLMSLLDIKPLNHINYVKETLQIFAVRVSAELERKGAVEKLEEYKQHLEQLVVERTKEVRTQAQIIGQVKDLIIITDLKGQIKTFNQGAEYLLKCKKTQLTGRDITAIFPIHEHRWVHDTLIPIVSKQGNHVFDASLLRRDGSLVDVYMSLSVLKDESGNPNSLLAYGIDMTERKKVERKMQKQARDLIEVNRELEAFSYSVSHDLRTPLRSIDGFSSILMEDCGNKFSAEGRRYLNRIRENTQRMSTLIDDLLMLSRINRKALETVSINMSEMAVEIRQMLQSIEPARNVDFVIEEGLSVQGDYTLLRVALNNLIGNAWKYTSKSCNARIEFKSRNNKGEILYYIHDNGVGFDMSYYDKLFGPFQRLHNDEDFEGNGIGLATVQRVIQRHGGRIWAESEVQKGATFYFTLQS